MVVVALMGFQSRYWSHSTMTRPDWQPLGLLYLPFLRQLTAKKKILMGLTVRWKGL